jgi:hypothetical protein
MCRYPPRGRRCPGHANPARRQQAQIRQRIGRYDRAARTATAAGARAAVERYVGRHASFPARPVPGVDGTAQRGRQSGPAYRLLTCTSPPPRTGQRRRAKAGSQVSAALERATGGVVVIAFAAVIKDAWTRR